MEDEILPIKALSEEEIIKNNYSLNQLWMISFKEKVQGPFLESQLKKIFIENKELKNNGFQFCNLEKEKWVSLENTYFLGTDKTYSIINNNEQFTFDRIASLVQDKTIDEQILVSSDMGSTYNPLRSLQEFQFLFSRIPKLPDMISKEQFFHDKTLQIKINQKKMTSIKGGVNTSLPGCGTIGILWTLSLSGPNPLSVFFNNAANICWNN